MLKRRLLLTLAVCVFIVVCFLRYTDSRRPLQDLYGAPVQGSRTVEYTLEIAGYPKPTATGVSYNVSLDGVPGILYINHQNVEATPGDRITGYFAITEKPWNTNVFTASLSGEPTIIPPKNGIPWRYQPAVWAKALREQLSRLFQGDTVQLFAGVLNGDRTGFGEALKSDLFVTGLTHVTSISGMHVSMLAGFLAFFLRNRRAAALITLPVILLFVAMSGYTPSALRAAVLCAVYLLLPLLGRDYNMRRALLLAFLILTALSPRMLFSAAFQLSFAATYGLSVFCGPLHRRLMSVPWHKLPLWRTLSSALASTLAATVFTLPISAFWFGGISIISPLSNAALLWLIGIIFFLGAAAALLSFIWMPLGWLIAFPAAWVAELFLNGVRLFARLPHAVIYTHQPYLLAWLVFAYALFILALWSKRRRMPIVMALVTFGLCFALTLRQNAADRLHVMLVDVGQGQCLILRSGGKTAVIDCGGGSRAGTAALQALQSLGEDTVDVLILTHFDADHINGVPVLMEKLTINRIIGPTGDRMPDYPVEVNTIPETIVLGDATLQLQTTNWIGEGNERCVTVLAELGSFSLLCTGDIGLSAERWLLRTQAIPELDVFVAGHHGSGGSSSRELLAALSPQVALISVGADNRYGHPHPDTMARLAQSGAVIYRSDESGTIHIRVP